MDNPRHFGKRVREILDQGLHVRPAAAASEDAARAPASDAVTKAAEAGGTAATTESKP